MTLLLLLITWFQTSDLEVVITNLENNEGQVMVALYDSEDGYESEDGFYKTEKVPIEDGRAVVVFENLPKGEYAIKVFHDQNNNGELDTNFIGIPKEGYGFSNNAKGTMGPPSFEKAKFRFENSIQHRINMIN